MKIGARPLAILAILLAAIFIRLGFWQLSRLGDRRALNTELASRATMPALPVSQVPTDSAAAHYRRVLIDGTYDYANEIKLTLRSRDGSPGINIVTPVRRPGTDTALMVVRGWVYAPDGMTADLSRWREGPNAQGEAFVETYPPARTGRNGSPTHSDAYRWLDRAELTKRFGYPLALYYVVLTSQPPDSGSHVPPRLGVPPMDEGPHQSYAIQWFFFAAISIIGMTLFIRRK